MRKMAVMKKAKLARNERRSQILAASLILSASKGYTKVTREEIAEKADVAPSLVSDHFGTMAEFRRCIMRHAVEQGNVAVIAQGLAARDPHARKASDALKKQAAALLCS